MGTRNTVVWLAVAVALSSACAGKSIRERNGESGAGGEPETAGTGGSKGGGASRGGSDSSSSGGTAPRGGTDSPPVNGSGGTGATGGGTGATGGGTGATGGGTGATGGGTGTTGGAAGGAVDCALSEVPILPDPAGWIDLTEPCNLVHVQGGWYVFGDPYGNATCLKPGQHTPSECAHVTTPDPESGVFPNVNGEMHTAGVVEKILPCPAGLMTSGCPENDYANMWGAGIGFDFNGTRGGDGAERSVWNAYDNGVIAVRFSIDVVPLSGLRVEFPLLLTDAEAAAASPPLPSGSTTDDHYSGAPYWGAQSRGDSHFPLSPVMPGVNTIYWADIQPPVLSAYQFDPQRLLGMRFHVPTSSGSAAAYDFTISDVRMILEVK